MPLLNEPAPRRGRRRLRRSAGGAKRAAGRRRPQLPRLHVDGGCLCVHSSLGQVQREGVRVSLVKHFDPEVRPVQ